MNKIAALRPNGKITKAELIQLGSDPTLEHFQIICHWTDGETTGSWSSGINNGQMALGAIKMQYDINNAIFGDEEYF